MRLLRLALCLLAPAILGCNRNDGPERVVVTGEVSYHGKPLKDGRIRFVPSPRSSSPVAVAEILDGKYRAAALGGVAVGTYRIEVTAYHATHQDSAATLAPGLAENRSLQQYIPAKYNANTTLEFEVPPGSSTIVRNFDLIP